MASMLGAPPLWVSTLRESSTVSETDEDLMLEVQGGSREAFEALFQRYRAPIWTFFRRRIDDGSRAEELAQDAFLALLQGARRYEARASFRAYLFGIAYNVMLAERRRQGGRGATSIHAETIAAQVPDPDAAIWVRSALARLDSDDREILMLREYEQLSYQEIADLMSMPLNTVRSRLFRARAAMRVALIPTRPERSEVQS
jgi:RNA polymerase sigma-70 factor (ECF subfamily)